MNKAQSTQHLSPGVPRSQVMKYRWDFQRMGSLVTEGHHWWNLHRVERLSENMISELLVIAWHWCIQQKKQIICNTMHLKEKSSPSLFLDTCLQQFETWVVVDLSIYNCIFYSFKGLGVQSCFIWLKNLKFCDIAHP